MARRRVMAGLLAALFLTVLGLAQFETLHRMLHAEAAQPNHQCAVTLLQSGQIETPPTAGTMVNRPAEISCALLPPPPLWVEATDATLPPDRGPPAFCS